MDIGKNGSRSADHVISVFGVIFQLGTLRAGQRRFLFNALLKVPILSGKMNGGPGFTNNLPLLSFELV